MRFEHSEENTDVYRLKNPGGGLRDFCTPVHERIRKSSSRTEGHLQYEQVGENSTYVIAHLVCAWASSPVFIKRKVGNDHAKDTITYVEVQHHGCEALNNVVGAQPRGEKPKDPPGEAQGDYKEAEEGIAELESKANPAQCFEYANEAR